MSYDYDVEKQKVFCEEGFPILLKVRDQVKKLLKTSGAFRLHAAISIPGTYDSWTLLACVDYLEREGMITCVYSKCSTQNKVYIAGGPV